MTESFFAIIIAILGYLVYSNTKGQSATTSTVTDRESKATKAGTAKAPKTKATSTKAKPAQKAVSNPKPKATPKASPAKRVGAGGKKTKA